MAVDKLVDSTQLDSDLTSVANAIRTKGGTSASLAFPSGFVSAVNALPTPTTPTIQSLSVNPSTSQQTFNASGVDGYKPVTVSAMPSGTAGTPTATKGTVTNHSVDVTPSVTNTTGYITGSTKTGTALTVSASELVSGSETKTANGTYDVTNLAQLIVNVAGGGGSGLVYESGTYTPTADIAKPDISFANSHTKAPIFVAMADETGTVQSQSSSNVSCIIFGYYLAFGANLSSVNTNYASIGFFTYRASSSQSSGTNFMDATTTWVSATKFIPQCGSTARYWRSGRTYKWIAVWGPTT